MDLIEPNIHSMSNEACHIVAVYVVLLQFRSWYVETASPVKKNLVIIIDRSGSMSGPRMRLAIEAALTVLDTLSPQDNVSNHHIARKITLTKAREIIKNMHS